MMRSRLFRAIFEDPASNNAKAFARHLRELISLNDQARSACIEALPQALKPVTDFQGRKLIEDLANASSADPQSVENSLSVLGFLVKALLSDAVPRDDHANWAEDLRDLEGITESHLGAFQAILDTLTKKRDDWQLQDRESRATSGVTPRFKSMGVTAEARAVRRENYRWGTPVEQYEPGIVGVTYIASVSIGLSEGHPEKYYFQMDETDIDYMIGSLIAVKKELAALRAYVGRGNEGC